MTPPPIVFDTDVLLNLLAAGIGEGVLRSLEAEALVCITAAAETIYIRSDDPTQPFQSVSIEHWTEAKLIALASPVGPEEENLYVQFASRLDDGEAMALAICRSRSFRFATDDRKARRVAGSLLPEPVPLLSTAEILHVWAERTAPSSERTRGALQSIERRARFIPPLDDPFRDWWLASR